MTFVLDSGETQGPEVTQEGDLWGEKEPRPWTRGGTVAERATPWMDGVPVGRGHSQGKEWRDDRWGRGEACGFLAVGGSARWQIGLFGGAAGAEEGFWGAAAGQRGAPPAVSSGGARTWCGRHLGLPRPQATEAF